MDMNNATKNNKLSDATNFDYIEIEMKVQI